MIPLKKPGTCLPAGRCKARNFPGMGVLIVRRSERKIEATPQIGFFSGIMFAKPDMACYAY